VSEHRESRETRLTVKVTPNAGRNEITGLTGDILRVRIAAPPEKGKANKELIDFLSEGLGVKKSDISIVSGLASRNKVIVISGIGRQEINNRISI
jgi:uncharacterized protein (TIGR00251 family)